MANESKTSEIIELQNLGCLNCDYSREKIIEPIQKAAKNLGLDWVEVDSGRRCVQKYVLYELNCYYTVDSSD